MLTKNQVAKQCGVYEDYIDMFICTYLLVCVQVCANTFAKGAQNLRRLIGKITLNSKMEKP